MYGPPGPDGKKGIKGMDGLPGNFGPRGIRGPVGEHGANAIFCPCPLEMELLDGKQTVTYIFLEDVGKEIWKCLGLAIDIHLHPKVFALFKLHSN